MEFKIKPFAQLMILDHEVALIFDDITKGEFRIDSYEIEEHPEYVNPNLKEAMNQAYDIAISNTIHKELYQILYTANDNQLFWDLLKKKNDQRKQLL